MIGPTTAGQIERPRVAADIQFDLTLKILTFDRNLHARVGEELFFVIIYEKNFPPSLQVKAEIEQAIEASPFKAVDRIPLRAAVIDISATRNWISLVEDSGADVVYIAPLREPALVRLLSICREKKITTVGSLPIYSSRGATIGFEPPGGRPVIVINLGSAMAEGADFNSRLLSLAKVIR